MNEYVDVRGPHPVYINGMTGIIFDGFHRSITVEYCRKFIKSMNFFAQEYSTYTIHHPAKNFNKFKD